MFFQLFAENLITGLLPDKNQLFMHKGVKLPLYPLISAENGRKCLKNVKKFIKNWFFNSLLRIRLRGIVKHRIFYIRKG